MIINDTRLAVLRVLARSEYPLTAREVADRMHGHGRHANQTGGNYPSVSTVKAHLLELQRDEGTYRSWATPAGFGPRNATTYVITDLGRERLAALDAQTAREQGR